MSPEEKQRLVTHALGTPEGRRKLGAAMFPNGIRGIYDTYPGIRALLDREVAQRIAAQGTS